MNFRDVPIFGVSEGLPFISLPSPICDACGLCDSVGFSLFEAPKFGQP